MILRELFGTELPIIGSIALGPLPGSPRFGGELGAVVDTAVEDARVLEAGGVDALSLENMGDAPFFASQVPAESVASFGRVVGEVRRRTDLPIGVKIATVATPAPARPPTR